MKKSLLIVALLAITSGSVSPITANTPLETNDSAFAGGYNLPQSALSAGNQSIQEHYGDPASFMKYIIRIPPVYA